MFEHFTRRFFGFHQEGHRKFVLVGQAGADETGVGHLHLDACIAQIGVETFGQGHDPRLGCGIADGPGQTAEAGQRARDHHMAGATRDHGGQHRANHAGAAGKVDIAHRLDLFGVPLLRLCRPIDARQIHHPIHGADLGRRVFDRGAVCHIAGHGAGLARQGADGGVEPIFRPGRQDHLCPGARHHLGKGKAQAFGSAHKPIAFSCPLSHRYRLLTPELCAVSPPVRQRSLRTW